MSTQALAKRRKLYLQVANLMEEASAECDRRIFELAREPGEYALKITSRVADRFRETAELLRTISDGIAIVYGLE